MVSGPAALSVTCWCPRSRPKAERDSAAAGDGESDRLHVGWVGNQRRQNRGGLRWTLRRGYRRRVRREPDETQLTNSVNAQVAHRAWRDALPALQPIDVQKLQPRGILLHRAPVEFGRRELPAHWQADRTPETAGAAVLTGTAGFRPRRINVDITRPGRSPEDRDRWAAAS